MDRPVTKPLFFAGSSLKELRALPVEVRRVFGVGLYFAQKGEQPEGARRFGEGLPHGVMKLSENFKGDTYRAAYTTEFRECVCLLAAFMKKSKTGKATPREDIDRIAARWQEASRCHGEWLQHVRRQS